MHFSTYKLITYVGLVLFPFILYGLFYVQTGSSGFAFGLSVFMTLIIVPLQFWKLSRLQSRLDDHDGSIPMGWAFDWDLEDDETDDDSPLFSSPTVATAPTPAETVWTPKNSAEAAPGRSETTRICPSCGASSDVSGERFCPFCGTSMSRALAL